MSIRCFAGIVLLCLLVSLQQKCPSQPIRSYRVKWETTPKNNVPLIPITLSDGKTRLFVLDTGSPATTIDRGVAHELNLPVQTYTFENPVEKVDYVLSSADIGPGSLPLKQVPFILSDLSALRQVEPRLSGIIGTNVLANFTFRLDYPEKTVDFILGTIADSKLEPTGSKRFPLIKSKDKYYVDAVLDGITGRFCIDTGTHHTFVRSQDMVKSIKPIATLDGLQNAIATDSGTGLRIENTRLLRLKRLVIGDMAWDRPIVSQGQSPSKNTDNGIGNDFFQRFHVLVDLPGKALYLSPNPSYKPMEDEWIGTGLELNIADGKVIIGRIFSPSSAQKAGLHSGDEVTAYNEKSFKGLAVSEIQQILQKKAFDIGETLEIEVLPKGSSVTRRVKLRIQKLL